MDLGYYLNLEKRFLKIAWKELIEYKVNFLSLILVIVVEGLIYALFWKILFSQGVNTFNGWKLEEAISLIVFNYIYWLFGATSNVGIYIFTRSVKLGNFDKYLIYPFNPIIPTLFRTYDLKGIIADIIIVLILVIYLIKISSFTLLNWLLAFVFVFLGMIIYISFSFIVANCVFWVQNYTLIRKITTELPKRFIMTPLTIVGNPFLFIFKFMLPVIVIATVPAEILRGNFTYDILFYELFMMGVLLIIAKVVWKLGLRRYESGMG